LSSRFAAIAPHRKQIAPERVAEGRRLYEQTVTPVRDIATMLGVCCTTLQNRINEWGWKRRDYHSNLMRALRADEVAVESVRAPAPDQPMQSIPAEPVAPADRAAIADRMARSVEQHLDAVERVLKVLGPTSKTEATRAARTLAHTARMLREIAAITQPNTMTPPDETDDDPVPRDIDEFREALARRIEAFIAGQRAIEDGGVPDDRGDAEVA